MPVSESKLLTPSNARWPMDRRLEEDLGYWKIAYLKPRNEKVLASECERLGIGYYLPLFTKVSRRRDNGKPRKSVLPLFSGYFPFVDRDEARIRIAQTNRIVNFISISDQEQFVNDLTQVWQALQSGADIVPVQTFHQGQKVRVCEGPLQGVIGTVEDTLENRRLLLTVEEFRMSVSVQLDQEAVEVLH